MGNMNFTKGHRVTIESLTPNHHGGIAAPFCLDRVLARSGRAGGIMRLCASSPPSSGYTAMPMFRIARWRSARGMTERWNLEVAITAARRLATAGLQLEAVVMMRIRINTASKLGPHTQTDQGTCPGAEL
jgi:hypothetical protein